MVAIGYDLFDDPTFNVCVILERMKGRSVNMENYVTFSPKLVTFYVDFIIIISTRPISLLMIMFCEKSSKLMNTCSSAI